MKRWGLLVSWVHIADFGGTGATNNHLSKAKRQGITPPKKIILHRLFPPCLTGVWRRVKGVRVGFARGLQLLQSGQVTEPCSCGKWFRCEHVFFHPKMATDRFQTPLLSVRLERFALFLCSLPLLSFMSCVAIALVWHFDETTNTHCNVSINWFSCHWCKANCLLFRFSYFIGA